VKAKPVKAPAPEFPKRDALYAKVGILGATLLTGACGGSGPPKSHMPGGGGTSEMSAGPMEAAPKPDDKPIEKKQDDTKIADMPAPPPQPEPAKPEPVPEPPKPEPVASFKDGSVDGKEIDLKAKPPAFKVYREGGGIGPAEDMWEPSEVEAFLSFTLAKEGKLNLKSKQKLDYDGVSIQLDAWDAEKKIGYAYVDRFDSSPEITPAIQKKLDAWMKGKKVAILFVDMKKIPDQATLKGKVLKFVAEVKKTPPAAGPL
jgi:hypothetical protein